MPVTVYAIDEEFGVSSGDNVNDGPGTSTFDYPPSATSNLVITSKDGDPDPYPFDPGDTYEISWDGMGGGGTITDAVVVRSDPVSINGDDGHAVVFEGLDESGELVQVVWSPGFDLEQWFFDNFDAGQPPGFYTSDTNPDAEYSYVCFAAGTQVAVPGGTCAVQDLEPGDQVITLDHGVQTLRWVGRRTVGAWHAMAPIEFEPGAVGNEDTLVLSPQHRVLVQCWRAELLFGSNEVLVPAKAFLGQPGVRRIQQEAVTYVHLLFDQHEIVVAEGIACESLLLGEIALGALTPPDDDATNDTGALFPEILNMPQYHGMETARPVLRVGEASVMFNRPPPAPVAQPACLI